MLVTFAVSGRQVAAQVIPTPNSASVPWWLAVAADGEMYDRQPEEAWQTLPTHLAGSVRARTDAQLRRGTIQHRIALMFDSQAIIRLHAKPARQRGTDKAWQALGSTKEATETPRGRLAPGDIPLNLAHWGSSHLSAAFEARLVYSWDAPRRRQMMAALQHLAPREAAAFRWCLLGGQPWTDEHGRLMTCTMQPAQLARQWGVHRTAVYHAIRRAFDRLTEILGFDPRDYCSARPDAISPEMDDVEGVAC